MLGSSRLWIALSALGLAACGQQGIAFTTGSGGGSPSASAAGSANGGSSASNGGGASSGGSGGIGGVASGSGAGGATSASSSSASTSTSTASGGGGAGPAASSSSATTGAGGSGGSVCGMGGAGGTMSTGPAPSIVQAGSGAILLRGLIVPDPTTTPFAGEVLVQGDTITCVAASCAATAGASTATIVQTNGIVMPGLIDTHNHILFDIFDATDWSPSQPYTNHNQWTNDPKYGALVDAKQYLNGEGSADDFGCEMDKYGELKALVAGATSVVGAANPADKKCYGSLTRTIDQSPNGLTADDVQVATLFPTTSAADGVCANYASGKTHAFVIHDGEGVDATALAEFPKLGTITTTDDCLYDPHTAIVHGAAFGDPEFTTMAAHAMSLVWSPQSNVFLYGAGTDLTKTANVPLALSKGINVALAPDWSIGGSQNLLDELRFAQRVSTEVWSSSITSQMLFQMVTLNAAKVLGLDSVLGSLAVGKKADIMVFAGNTAAPYDALIAATPRDVNLVMVGGVALYGDPAIVLLGPAAPGCETIEVCCDSKFVCVAETATNDKLNQTYAEIRSALVTALSDYDALHLSQWTFSPITPLVRCP